MSHTQVVSTFQLSASGVVFSILLAKCRIKSVQPSGMWGCERYVENMHDALMGALHIQGFLLTRFLPGKLVKDVRWWSWELCSRRARKFGDRHRVFVAGGATGMNDLHIDATRSRVLKKFGGTPLRNQRSISSFCPNVINFCEPTWWSALVWKLASWRGSYLNGR